MESLKKTESHYFVCEACEHVIKARSLGYKAPCPCCGGPVILDDSETAKLLYLLQKGGVEDVRKG